MSLKSLLNLDYLSLSLSLFIEQPELLDLSYSAFHCLVCVSLTTSLW